MASEGNRRFGSVLVTGGAGFIGSNFVRRVLVSKAADRVTNFDALTYAGNLENLTDVETDSRYSFVRGDVADPAAVKALFAGGGFDLVVNFAAESHVDRSILGAAEFVRTNVSGTQTLLDAFRESKRGRFLQVSTDEVYGSLGPTGKFTEETPLAPNSPYSASKAGGDLLVRAAHHTHGQDVVVTRCSNNYGAYQFPEKLIPLMVVNALEGKPLPVYGDGMNVRDWIHVDDHCDGILAVARQGSSGDCYNLGGDSEKPNIEIVKAILSALGKPQSAFTYVKDRPGHDRRYAIDYSKALRELSWRPRVRFEDGLKETVEWYVRHRSWWERVRSQAYLKYYEEQYGGRLGGKER
jgi:dTDP-glucose 4,6-dehydratase